MRRILIDDRIRGIAKKYKSLLEKKKGRYKTPLERLKQLVGDNRLDETQKKYVQLIIDKWDELILLEPPFNTPFNTVIGDFEKIYISSDVATMKIGKQLFHELIVSAMRYDHVQSTIYREVIADLDIKTCVYCNAQYAFSHSLGRNHFQNYEIDHWMPKSKYPYLCTSFYNLQPSCPKCNKSKSNRDDILPFCLYTKDSAKLNPFDFNLDNASCAMYLATHDRSKLEISFNAREAGLKDWMDNLFHISFQYQAHKDVVEELVWKKKIYNKTIQEIYKESFKGLGFNAVDFNRFILGNYGKEEDILKRPLSKLMQDVAKHLGIIK